LDNSLKVWDLLDFNQIYHIRFDILCSEVQMMNEKLIFVKTTDHQPKSFFIKVNVGLLKPFLSEAKVGTLVDLFSDG
jgi:hypothetical protein